MIGILGMVGKIIHKVIDMIGISRKIDNLFRIPSDNLYHRYFGNLFHTLPDKLHRNTFDIPGILIHRHVGNLFRTLFDKYYRFDKYHKYYKHRKFGKIFDKAFDIIGKMVDIIDNIDMVDKSLDKLYRRLDMVDRFGILGMADSIDILHMVGKFDI